jgi:hypothetical protein
VVVVLVGVVGAVGVWVVVAWVGAGMVVAWEVGWVEAWVGVRAEGAVVVVVVVGWVAAAVEVAVNVPHLRVTQTGAYVGIHEESQKSCNRMGLMQSPDVDSQHIHVYGRQAHRGLQAHMLCRYAPGQSAHVYCCCLVAIAMSPPSLLLHHHLTQ